MSLHIQEAIELLESASAPPTKQHEKKCFWCEECTTNIDKAVELLKEYQKIVSQSHTRGTE